MDAAFCHPIFSFTNLRKEANSAFYILVIPKRTEVCSNFCRNFTILLRQRVMSSTLCIYAAIKLKHESASLERNWKDKSKPYIMKIIHPVGI
jgi:hypothetical protein